MGSGLRGLVRPGDPGEESAERCACGEGAAGGGLPVLGALRVGGSAAKQGSTEAPEGGDQDTADQGGDDAVVHGVFAGGGWGCSRRRSRLTPTPINARTAMTTASQLAKLETLHEATDTPPR